MNERKATKRALLTSITALVMCVVMLVGTTFAWFTDTATANVNKIEAGKLDVQLMMKVGNDWKNAEGETLKWVKAQGGENQAILWEPGAEYKLPELKVVNGGNLALKYEIKITGAVDADGRDDLDSKKLLDVLKFKSVVDNTTKENVYGQTIATGTLDANDKEQIIQLSAKMDENAGNKYQEMAISGIAITVKAMQASHEYDSNGNTYDRDANGNPDNPTWSISANVTAPVVSGGVTVISNADKTAVATVPADAVDTSTTELTWNVTASDSAAASVRISSAQAAVGYDVSVVGLKTGNTTPVKVELKVGAGLTDVVLYHNSSAMTKGTSADSLTDSQYFYNESTGILTFVTSTFSPFAVVYDAPAMTVDGVAYYDLTSAVAAAKDGDTITLLRDVSSGRIILEDKSITVDLNGHTLTSTSAYGVMFCAKNGNTITVNGTTPGSKLVGTVMVTAETDGHIVLNGGTYENKNYIPVYINGAVNTDNSTLTITDAVINAIGSGNNEYGKWGVYLAGYATSTIENTTITASVTGIEIRAGKLALNDCALEAIAKEFSCEPNGNGTTTAGAAIAIAQHTTKKDIAVTINGGSFKGVKALNESNPQVNDPTPQVKLSIDGGTFIGDVSTADVTGFIKGGTFSSQPDSSYVATGYTATESNGVWTVAKSTQSST